jgi:1D-myo-inositol-triphosphate 3-kinase
MRLTLKFSRIAAGHARENENSIRQPTEESDGKPLTLLKLLDPQELAIYTGLSCKYEHDVVHEFVPAFHGVFTDVDENNISTKYIRIKNLLYDFRDPKVMDVKLGFRTFIEKEACDTKPRPDLFQKMLAMYPSVLTPEEVASGQITKHRWMSTRDKHSTISSLGYRIDGVAGYQQTENLVDILSQQDTCSAFRNFALQTVFGELASAESLSTKLVEQLRRMHTALQSSSFFYDHEFVGSSALLVADYSGHAGVFWIDFGKTFPVEEGMKLTHYDMWTPGNHEDGILLGLENLISAWEIVKASLHQEANGWALILNTGVTGAKGSSSPRTQSRNGSKAKNEFDSSAVPPDPGDMMRMSSVDSWPLLVSCETSVGKGNNREAPGGRRADGPIAGETVLPMQFSSPDIPTEEDVQVQKVLTGDTIRDSLGHATVSAATSHIRSTKAVSSYRSSRSGATKTGVRSSPSTRSSPRPSGASSNPSVPSAWQTDIMLLSELPALSGCLVDEAECSHCAGASWAGGATWPAGSQKDRQDHVVPESTTTCFTQRVALMRKGAAAVVGRLWRSVCPGRGRSKDTICVTQS